MNSGITPAGIPYPLPGDLFNPQGSLEQVVNSILSAVYPVGTIYMSSSPASPSTTFGGTWVPWGAGRVPVGVGSNGVTTYPGSGLTGGADRVLLTAAQSGLRQHNHGQDSHRHTSAEHSHPNAHTHPMPHHHAMAHHHAMTHTHPMPHHHAMAHHHGAGGGARNGTLYAAMNPQGNALHVTEVVGANTSNLRWVSGASGTRQSQSVGMGHGIGVFGNTAASSAANTGASSAANTGASSAANTGASSAANTGASSAASTAANTGTGAAGAMTGAATPPDTGAATPPIHDVPAAPAAEGHENRMPFITCFMWLRTA